MILCNIILNKMTVRYVLVTIEPATLRVPKVLEDYIYSLNIISEVIHISQLTVDRLKQTTDIFILTQMWLDVNIFSSEMIQSSRIFFLNVEMVSEITRIKWFIKKYNQKHL